VNQIDGYTHDRSKRAPVPTIFGMNFQAVSVGQKLVEGSKNNLQGGYLDAFGTPTAPLLSEIEYVDTSIGKMIAELKSKGLWNSTLILITARHGQSPIDIHALLRIAAGNSALTSPSKLHDAVVAQSAEDDVSLLWFSSQDRHQTAGAVQTLEAHLGSIGGGEIFAGESLKLLFGDPLTDLCIPDIALTPNVGDTGGKKKISEHGGFANDDTNAILLVSNPALPGLPYSSSE